MPVGLLMVNLGSPDAPTPEATRRYLGQFLHDYRVVDTNRWIWCPILHGVILRIRPARSAKAYASIWGEEGAEAPLVRFTRSQVAGVQERLGDEVMVETAMRYGNPSIDAGLETLMAAGCTKIAVLPLYPQYAGATTASVYDGVAKALVGKWNVPELRFLRDYYREPDFIASLGNSLSEHLDTLDWTPDRVMCSYHGLPQTYVDAGDPYQGECLKTTALLRAHTGYSETVLVSTFQSRFGPKAWLQPYTDKTLEAMPDQGLKKVAIMMPGFSSDCLETLEEISIEAAETFHEAGGTHFTVVPCLNDRTDHIDMLAEIARRRLLSDWLDPVE